MRTLVLVTLVLLPLGLDLQLREARAAGEVCSRRPLPTTRDESLTYLLGTAKPDTVHSGAGSVAVSSGPGHWSRGTRGPVYGQVVQVQRFGGADSASIARAFHVLGSRDVVLVPWDYDAACRPTRWGRSAVWSPVGREGAYTVTPRAEEGWVEGRPTFDVYAADLEPYPHGLFFQRGYRGTDRLRTEPSLTAEEYYELHRAIPTAEQARRDPVAAERVLSQWEQEHSGAREKYPAADILSSVRGILQRAR